MIAMPRSLPWKRQGPVKWGNSWDFPDHHGRGEMVDVQVTPMLDAKGHVRRLLAISRDITDYKRVQESLHASEERLESVIRGSTDGFGQSCAAGTTMELTVYTCLVVTTCA